MSVLNTPKSPKSIQFSNAESEQIDREICEFLEKGVIEEVLTSEENEYYSNIFIRPKKDGSVRVILNLKKFNDYMEKVHFKMETLRAALAHVHPGDFFASIDLKDAYFSVPIAKTDRKYLRFIWNNNRFQFCILPQGLASSPCVFTKLLKSVYATLRKFGHFNTPYIDDSLLKGSTFNDCQENIKDTVLLVDSLGFTIHPEKSVFFPTQEIVFLGFVVNSLTMTVRLTPERADNLVQLCVMISGKTTITIREFAKLIGKMVASEPDIRYAPLYYRDLEHVKDANLKRCFGNFDSYMEVTELIKNNLEWWITNTKQSYKLIITPEPDIFIHSDSSKSGYGGINNSNGDTTEGQWTEADQREHINYLELKGAFLVLQKLNTGTSNCHIRLFLDNTVAISYINNFGGKTERLHLLSKQLWSWAISKNIWISAVHVPGSENFEADRLSRNINDDAEWMLKPQIFKRIESLFGKIQIDLFASKLNNQISEYVSFKQDKNAIAIDAFSFNWNCNKQLYLFPPFCVIGRVLQKISKDKVNRILLVAPIWPTQIWFPTLLQQIVEQSYIFPRNCLQLPTQIDRKHPIRNLRMGAFILSGNNSLIKDYQKSLLISSCTHGENQHINSMGHISEDGCNFQLKRRVIHLTHLPGPF